MTAQRSTAYGRVMRTLEDMGPAKLHDVERQRIRDAADTLLFSEVVDEAAIAAAVDVERLAAALRDAGRWSAERAQELAEDVAACGPLLVAEPVGSLA